MSLTGVSVVDLFLKNLVEIFLVFSKTIKIIVLYFLSDEIVKIHDQ